MRLNALASPPRLSMEGRVTGHQMKHEGTGGKMTWRKYEMERQPIGRQCLKHAFQLENRVYLSCNVIRFGTELIPNFIATGVIVMPKRELSLQDVHHGLRDGLTSATLQVAPSSGGEGSTGKVAGFLHQDCVRRAGHQHGARHQHLCR